MWRFTNLVIIGLRQIILCLACGTRRGNMAESSRFFAAKASPACGPCDLRIARPLTLCAFRLREPTVCHPRIWHSLSRRGARRGFPNLDGARSFYASEEMLHLLPPCQDRSHYTPVKACNVHDLERLRLTPSRPCDRKRLLANKRNATSPSAWAPFRLLQPPACHGDGLP